MDSSPLVKAHDHALAAAKATKASDTTTAVNEHAHAAGEFANASKATTCHEALRTLALLEQHHRRLSDLLKQPVRPPAPADAASEPENKEGQQVQEPASSAVQKDQPAAARKTANKPPPALSPQRYPTRNLSSSIASNLASARGIRAKYTTQPLTSVSNDQAPGSLEVRPRSDFAKGKPESRKPSWVPPVIPEDSADEPPKPEPSSSPPSEDGFSRFYNTFGSLISRLSAPLAFAGLPLVAEESAPAPNPVPPEPKRSRPKPTPPAAEPDLSKIYSRATLRALKRDSASDSFYVVPTSGHTASYASILNHDNKGKRHQGSIRSSDSQNDGMDDEDDDGDFVDAREVPPASTALRQKGAGGKESRTEAELRNEIEELRLQNASLKEDLDRVSKRLHAFELTSQSSHLALAQSLRLQKPGSPMSSSTMAGTAGEEALKKRNRELEEQLAEMARRFDALEADHVKLQLTVEKYRDRWEKLKAGAKARRQQNQEAEGPKK
ncbi:hypothetical protein VTJ04DRAFT_5531 [Mycothermus thermophilus]|uniref:uncharacterized protein n=1 Tax=Humicola insolens TaxID=85995 RepID=UPI0037446100